MALSDASYSPLKWNDGNSKTNRLHTSLYALHSYWKETLLFVLAISTTLLSIAVFDQRVKPEALKSEYSM